MAAILDLMMLHEVRVSWAGLEEAKACFALVGERDLPVDPLPRFEDRGDAEEMDVGDFGGRDRLWEHELSVFLLGIHVSLADAVVPEDRSIITHLPLLPRRRGLRKPVLLHRRNQMIYNQKFHLLVFHP